MSVVTRFAPSPTGFLHIGSARTALFNWLFARHHGGKFLLRIEDTDRERSTQEAIDAIHDSMKWLQLDHDEDVYLQSNFAERHAQVAYELLEKGSAYKCYCTTTELDDMREKAIAEKRSPRYDGRCRDREPSNLPFTIRFKAPTQGSTTLHDLVQGDVTVQNDQLDDMVLLRADGTPTYMLSVVVDDHDMAITHIIRGDDHLTNAFRQYHLYRAMGWDVPQFSHIPLIHGPDGAKMSKRHGALGAEAYRDMGILPEAMCNYLLRLGWGHGDDEIISRPQAIEWFDGTGIGKSPARFDVVKLMNLNSHYLRELENADLVERITPELHHRGFTLTPTQKELLLKAMTGLKIRAKNLLELVDNCLFYIQPLPMVLDEKAVEIMTPENKDVLRLFAKEVASHEDWTEPALEEFARSFAERHDVKLGKLAQPLRAALTGRTVSPSVF
ncbi:MAG: glutamate--tRNA ligase, partial [Alphaproteobacteria bacterium]|nr:glutamate--tRNA ligase [Alphaproteobacteria bacterium]